MKFLPSPFLFRVLRIYYLFLCCSLSSLVMRLLSSLYTLKPFLHTPSCSRDRIIMFPLPLQLFNPCLLFFLYDSFRVYFLTLDPSFDADSCEDCCGAHPLTAC